MDERRPIDRPLPRIDLMGPGLSLSLSRPHQIDEGTLISNRSRHSVSNECQLAWAYELTAMGQ